MSTTGLEAGRSAAQALFERGLAAYTRGDLSAAERAQQEVLRLQPDNVDALHLLGLIARQTGRSGLAVDLIGRALAINGAIPVAHNNLANALVDLGRLEDGVASYDRALALRPEFTGAWLSRAFTLMRLQRYPEALESFERVIEQRADLVVGHSGRAAVLLELNRLPEALDSFDRVISLQPNDAAAHNGRGAVLQDLQRPGAALVSLDRAIALDPQCADAYNNRGITLGELGRHDAALDSFAAAARLRPDDARPRLNTAHALLQRGEFERGWPLYEWRGRLDSRAAPRALPKPVWTGSEDLAGKTLYVYCEQGLGDTIQFCRYALLAASRGAKVILAVQPRLCRLLGRLSPNVEVIPDGQTPAPGDFHFHSPLLSLPGAFRTRVDSIPAEGVPYLFAEPERVAHWREMLGTDGFRVGVAWQGDLAKIDVGRSFPLALFEELAGIAGVKLISLQKGPGAEQLRSIPKGMVVQELGVGFDSGSDGFLDTAAVMESLDLVITSDTSVAHLAGALGRPAWVLLRRVPDWRWMLTRADSPWYPSLRLFRQPYWGDWASVFGAVHAELSSRVAAYVRSGAR